MAPAQIAALYPPRHVPEMIRLRWHVSTSVIRLCLRSPIRMTKGSCWTTLSIHAAEWLVEIPYSTSWADIPGCDDVDISAITAAAQFDFYMQVQKFYTAHNTSATIEYRENEIEELST